MYCNINNVLATVPEIDLIQLTDDSSPAAEINQDNVDRAISDAGELIDGYLRGRYALPMSPVPGLINTLAADLTIYRLYARRIKLSAPEGVTERYKAALKILEQIQSGKISLGSENTGGGIIPETEGPQFSSAEKMFTRTSLKGF